MTHTYRHRKREIFLHTVIDKHTYVCIYKNTNIYTQELDTQTYTQLQRQTGNRQKKLIHLNTEAQTKERVYKNMYIYIYIYIYMYMVINTNKITSTPTHIHIHKEG